MVATRSAALGAALVLATAGLAGAQTAAPASPPSPPTPPAARDGAPLPPIAFSGELRTRSEWDRPDGPAAADLFTYLRSRFAARVTAAPGARLFLQVQDSRVLGAEGSTAAGAPAVFDLHQGWLELVAPVKRVDVAVRAGRQEIALGNERLVGAVGWSNTGRSFDGARITAAPRGATPGAEPWSATAFAATVEERGRHFGPAVSTSAASTSAAPGASPADHVVAGLFAVRALPAGAAVEGLALYDVAARYRAYDGADRVTLYSRLRAPRVLGVRAELEGAVQLGRQRYVPTAADAAPVEQDVRAWLLGARVGTPAGPTARASAALGVDVLSGDASPTDGRYGAFSTMFATNHPFYGLMDVVGDPAATTKERGLVDAVASGSLALSSAAALKGEVHRFALATGADRPLGWEADVTVPLRLSPGASVDFGYSVFRADRGAAAVGLGADGALRNWAYLQLRAGF